MTRRAAPALRQEARRRSDDAQPPMQATITRSAMASQPLYSSLRSRRRYCAAQAPKRRVSKIYMHCKSRCAAARLSSARVARRKRYFTPRSHAAEMRDSRRCGARRCARLSCSRSAAAAPFAKCEVRRAARAAEQPGMSRTMMPPALRRQRVSKHCRTYFSARRYDSARRDRGAGSEA